jgi:small-conductance mechanosensitive channel
LTFAALLAAMLVAPARLVLNRWGEARLAKQSAAGRPAVALIAVWWVVVAVLTPLFAGVAIQRALATTGASTPLFAQIFSLFWKTAVFGALVEGVARALLSPKWPAWRVAPISDIAARRLAPYPALIAFSAALAGFQAGLSSLLGFSSATSQAIGCLTLLLQLAVIASALSQIGRARVAEAEAVCCLLAWRRSSPRSGPMRRTCSDGSPPPISYCGSGRSRFLLAPLPALCWSSGSDLAATQTLRVWLESRYLPKTRMDLGVRTSLASGVTYIGVLVAFLLTCAYLGLSLDRIALFASALSVGIGFGLQAIIGNFVSGLIPLAERPIKVGDWIAIGDMEGDVRRINVRATEVEMGDHSRLIVPNSELVSKVVRNVTHGAALGRVKIVLSLDAQSDPLAVRDLLMQRLTAHPDALSDPAAAVYMTDIKDGAMEFTAFVYLASPRDAFKAKSDLLFQILPDLKAQGIALATSNPVVHVDVGDRPIEPSGAPA